eukprot:GHRR01004024.1.p1 GENE.GHRR01004024.1~~GHRR01004024.1.p1  ORF type:complete len:484 (+),score=94.29 GHRR01004024.1:171-1622(+)
MAPWHSEAEMTSSSSNMSLSQLSEVTASDDSPSPGQDSSSDLRISVAPSTDGSKTSVTAPNKQTQAASFTPIAAQHKERADVAAPLPANTEKLPGRHPAARRTESFSPKKRVRTFVIWGVIMAVVIVPAVVGSVYYTQVLLPQWRAADAAKIKPAVPPLPPMAPLTLVMYDEFNSFNQDSWRYAYGNGLERGWSFKGFGNDELQCFTADPSNVDVIPDPEKPGNQLLRLQGVYYPTPITCVPDQAPYNSTTTQWTSGRITTRGKRLFLAPANTTSTTNQCTSLIVEARMKVPLVKGTRVGLALLPETQNQTANAPRCEWEDECGAYGIWPASGEIDIAGHSDTKTVVGQAIQFREFGTHAWRAQDTDLTDTINEWHTYKLEWNCNYLRWFVDGVKTHGVIKYSFNEWPFDQPFYLSITYAIGGRLVDSNVEHKDSAVLVDYVKLYSADMTPPTTELVVTATTATVPLSTGNSTAQANSTTPTL